MLSVGRCGVARLQMKFGHMDGMHCTIDITSILVKIKSVELYNCRTVYFQLEVFLQCRSLNHPTPTDIYTPFFRIHCSFVEIKCQLDAKKKVGRLLCLFCMLPAYTTKSHCIHEIYCSAHMWHSAAAASSDMRLSLLALKPYVSTVWTQAYLVHCLLIISCVSSSAPACVFIRPMFSAQVLHRNKYWTLYLWNSPQGYLGFFLRHSEKRSFML